ncbi:hypothetical protein [Polaromonas sp. JS666]|uniref:hypothetical protein n=1 Tax=Polaromonas sp. (strain JS666 / ATCC BAA-500) TaxID=296591 RepID=UPI00005344A4|nr:hypothetical protein [Polaromonas sp. JS666]ABE45648.1 hypothetical protein Bpro_3749 [Polaromonas sp. JS666]
MLSERLRFVLSEAGGTQGDFATSIGMTLDRVKNILSGRVKKLQPHEARAIRDRYNIHELWLTTGKGPQHVTADELPVIKERDEIAEATRLVTELGLTGTAAREMQQLVYAMRRKSAAEVIAALEQIKGGGRAGSKARVANERAAWAGDERRPDEPLLHGVIEAVLTEIERKSLHIPPAKLAALIVAAYHASEDSHEVHKKTVAMLVRLAS